MSVLGEGIFNTLITNAVANGRETIVSPYIAYGGSFVSNFIPSFITCSFAVIMWICGHFFDCLNQSIESCLERPSPDFLAISRIYPQDHAEKLARLRRFHEDLCEAVQFLAKAFQFQVRIKRIKYLQDLYHMNPITVNFRYRAHVGGK